MRISNSGKTFITVSEGKRNSIYKDSNSKYTIGIGHLVKPNEQWIIDSVTITDAQVNTLFNNDCFAKEVYLNSIIVSKWEEPALQCEFDALADFIFQYGTNLQTRFPNTYNVFCSGSRSDIVRVLDNDFNNANVSKGDGLLVSRRQREIVLFTQNIYNLQ